jgi:hypothetical protein
MLEGGSFFTAVETAPEECTRFGFGALTKCREQRLVAGVFDNFADGIKPPLVVLKLKPAKLWHNSLLNLVSQS